MNLIRSVFILITSLLIINYIIPVNLYCQIEHFQPRQGGSTEIWRITNDPSVRHWPNYHNTDAWSPDGRYVCYEKYEPYDINPVVKVYYYDLHKDKETEIGVGKQPRWASKHNWLFYVEPVIGGEDAGRKGPKLMWLDVDDNKLTVIAHGVPNIGETDSDDRWIYGYAGRTPERSHGVGLRIPIRADSRAEIIENNPGYFWIPNPRHPVIQVRGSDDRSHPFTATRTFCDLEGKNITIGSPQIQRCHQSWSGGGEYLMHGGTGGTLMSGRKWNEPFPSNLHVISAIQCGDISSCGKSDRWVSGSSAHGPLQLADLRSGDGWNYLKSALSYIHDSYIYSYNHGSALNDNDAKGSADGTKIIFASNYDLKDGPVTEITENADPSTDVIQVLSTDGFPEKGTLSIGNEIVGYSGKTPVNFTGLTRNMFNTTGQNLDGINDIIITEYLERKSDEEFLSKYPLATLNKARGIVEKRPSTIRKGSVITSFDARLIPEAMRKKMKFPSFFASSEFRDDKNSILLWQRRTDVYIAVVRLPDQPHFSITGDGKAELIPGENHWETFAYNIFKDGKKITGKPLRPGENLTLISPGSYTASAVEWSGLESRQSFPLKVENVTVLKIRYDKPADFSWTVERWLINNQEVSEDLTNNSEEAVKEIVHLVEDVIHREWYNWGQIIKRYDLNSKGLAIRRLYYHNGNLAKREYHEEGINHVSTELFDRDGNYITESMQYQTVDNELKEIHHFWYQDGYPVKFTGRGGRHAADDGPGMYEKVGEKWIKQQAY